MSRSTEQIELDCLVGGALICVMSEEELSRRLPPLLCAACKLEAEEYTPPDVYIDLGKSGQSDQGEESSDG